jgi:hypothetical protein
MASTESVSHSDLAVCMYGAQEYRARDAIEAALFRGELEPLWREFLQCLAAESRADELEMELDEDALASAAETFRYEHDLITAEETEKWLAARGLSLDDFGDYFARKLYRSALEEKIEAENIDFGSASPELRETFTVDLILSGTLDRMTTALIWRLAALATAKENLDLEAIAAERTHFFERSGIDSAKLTGWLQNLGHDSEWFEQMLKMETTYQECRARLLDAKARKKELSILRLPLTRFEAEIIELDSRDAAKEALFCIRHDGMSMEEIASEGRYPYRQISFLQENATAELQQKLLSVRSGDVLEPIPRGDGFELLYVKKKIEPQADDPVVQTRIDQKLLERHFSELASAYVKPLLSAVASAE